MQPTSDANHWFAAFCTRHQIAVSGDVQAIIEKVYEELRPDTKRLDALSDGRILQVLDYDCATGLWDFVPPDAKLARVNLSVRAAIDIALDAMQRESGA